MAKTPKPCYRCGGGKLLPQHKHVEGGRCFRCGGSGIDPGADPQHGERREAQTHKRRPRPDGTEARSLADEGFRGVSRVLDLADAGKQKYGGWQDEYSSLSDLYATVGHGIAMAVFDPRFDRAVERARSRIPAQYHRDFEKGLGHGIREMAHRYEGIEWAGR